MPPDPLPSVGIYLRIIILTVATLLPAASIADTIRVPQDVSTIQGAIEAAAAGDTVLVGAGTYFENINFRGKAITVQSEVGPDTTIIDGGRTAPVVAFYSNEPQSSVLTGFTVRNGLSGGIWIGGSPTIRGNKIIENQGDFDGGGIVISGGAPLVEDNFISANFAGSGAGIGIRQSAAIVRRNVISGNYQDPFTGGSSQGGGIQISGAGSPQILDNLIENNSIGTEGGGIAMNAAGTPTIRGNIIRNNKVTFGSGGGISMSNHSDPLIVQNLIVGNQARGAAGVGWLTPQGGLGPTLVSNTIVNNLALGSPTGSSGIVANGFDEDALLINNIIVASPGQTAVLLAEFNDVKIPTFLYNNVYSPGGSAFAGLCCDPTGTNGNLSVNPLFTNVLLNDFSLRTDSPLIDMGDDEAPGLIANDILGNIRFIDGNGDRLAVIDIGAFEVVPEPTPMALAVPVVLALIGRRRCCERSHRTC